MPRALCIAFLPYLLAACATTGIPDLESVPRVESHAFAAEEGTELGRVFRMARLSTPSGFVTVDRNDDALHLRLALTDTAERSLDVQTYIWRDDRSGALLLQRLIQAADRGVRVRILIDDFTFEGSDHNAAVLALHPHVQVRVFNPVLLRGSRLARGVGMVVDLNRLNNRMHNKLFLADNQFGLVGGRNIGDEYFGLGRVFNHRDMELLAAGPIVEDLSDSFDVFWNSNWAVPLSVFASREPRAEEFVELRGLLRREVAADPDIEAQVGVEPRDWRIALIRVVSQLLPGEARVVRDKIGEELAPTQMSEELSEVVRGAREEILIVSAYFVPDAEMIEGIRGYVARGVRVRILTNSLASLDSPITNAVYKRWRKQLLEAGVELYELRSDAWERLIHESPASTATWLGLHAKASVIDHSTVLVGSMNMDPRSIELNTEIGLVVTSEPLCRQMRRAFARDFDGLNSWRVLLDEDGNLRWECSDFVVTRQPATSFSQRLSSFFWSLLPVEDQV